MRLHEMSASEIAAGVREKKFSAIEVFEDFLGSAAPATVTAEAGRAQARKIDEMVAGGEPVGLLAGVPVVLKDNVCTRGIPTTAGSRALENWLPPYDATAWALLAAEGAVLLGKSGMDEFDTDGAVYLPWFQSRACSGYALKPTYGLVSRFGLISRSSSFSRIGPVTKNMEDMAAAMRILARHDPKDSTSISHNEINFTKRTNTLKGRKIGIVKEFCNNSEVTKRAISLFEQGGAVIVEISLPMAARYASACYRVIMASETRTNLARYDGVRYGYTTEAAGLRDLLEAVRSESFGVDIKTDIIIGTYLAAPERFVEYFVAATRARTLIAAEYQKAFASQNLRSEKIDCILQPAAESFNVAGLPEFSFCEGLQITGPRWSDVELLDIGFEVEKIGKYGE